MNNFETTSLLILGIFRLGEKLGNITIQLCAESIERIKLISLDIIQFQFNEKTFGFA